MARESTIQVYRSNATVLPTGLTFGELAFTDVAGAQRLFIGSTAGSSIWIGAGVTDGGLANNSSVLVPTQSAVKTYVDGVVGGGSVVNTVNNSGGNIVVTGDNGAILKTTTSGTNTFTARVATTGLTGVASFNPVYFTTGTTGHVGLAAGYQVTGDTVSAGTAIGVLRSGNQVTISNAGIQSINGYTGTAQITGDAGSMSVIPNVSIPGASVYNVTARVATSTGLSGVAGFHPSDFTISATGNVRISGVFATLRDELNSTQNYNWGDTITLTGGNGIDVYQTSKGNIAFRGATATTTSLGVASFPTADFTVTSGAVNLKDVVRSVNGLTGALTITGDGSAIRGGPNNTITARNASTSLTGVASFNSASFDVSAGGDVTIKSGGVSNAQLANSSITIKAGSSDAGQAISLGSSFSITGTANQVTVSRTSTEYTIGLPNDITIPGNLTVNGTVITANVDNFVVEDPLFMLGTGNAADSVDLGFYSQYSNPGAGSRFFSGFFRKATDGKYRLFTGLTGAAEPTTTVNTAGSGYTVATLIANLDGGTF